MDVTHNLTHNLHLPARYPYVQSPTTLAKLFALGHSAVNAGRQLVEMGASTQHQLNIHTNITLVRTIQSHIHERVTRVTQHVICYTTHTHTHLVAQ